MVQNQFSFVSAFVGLFCFPSMLVSFMQSLFVASSCNQYVSQSQPNVVAASATDIVIASSDAICNLKP
jgi:hypothetical protein